MREIYEEIKYIVFLTETTTQSNKFNKQ